MIYSKKNIKLKYLEFLFLNNDVIIIIRKIYFIIFNFRTIKINILYEKKVSDCVVLMYVFAGE